MNTKNYDLSAKNPNGRGDIEHKSPKELLKSIQQKETRIRGVILEIEDLL